jgi:antitoxin ParD1/3/4
MVEMNFTFSEKIKDYIEQQTALEGFSSPSEYIEKLIHAEQKRDANAELEALLLEGLQSEPIVVTPEYWAERRTRLEERIRTGKIVPAKP